MTPTITQNLALFHMHRARNVNIQAALRFFDTRLRQIRRAARRQRIHLIWLKIKRAAIYTWSLFYSSFLFVVGFAALGLLAILLWINSKQ